MTDYMIYLGSILGLAGAGLQWIRQYRAVSDWWIGLACLVLATGGYALCHNFVGPVRKEIIEGLLWLPGGMATVAGGTFTASKASKSVPGIPETNSK